MTALVPVEGNPFGAAPTEAPQSPLVPVEGNPFDTVDHRAMQDRIGYGEMAVRVAKNMAASAKEGFGTEGVGFEAGSEAEHFWRQAGLLNDKDALVGPLFRGATVAGDAFMRAIKGATFAGAGAVEEIVKLSGGDPHHLKYELADAAMFAMNAAPMASPTGISGGLSRIRKGQDGVVRAEPIGETAKPADFQAAAEVLRESAGPEAKAAIEPKLKSLYEEQGIHPAEVLADAAQDPTLAKRLAADDPVLPPEYTGVDPVVLREQQRQIMAEDTGLRAESIREMPGVSPGLSQALQQRLVWPETNPEAGPVAPKAVKIGDHIGNLINRIGVGDIVSDIQMKTTPMAERNSSVRARAAAKDWANTMRVADFDVQTIVKELTKDFEATPERLAAMWEAADRRGVALRSGDKAAKLEGLTPAEARIVEGLQERLTNAWNEAKLVGILGEEAEGLESYAPRIVAGGKKKGEGFQTLDPRGRDFSVSSSFLNKRKYLTTEETEAAAKKALGDEAFVVRDIRTLALAEASLMRAVAGRRLINEIKEMGERSGAPTVFEGGVPKGVETFTIDQHPAFYTSKKLPDGTYERQAIRVSREFEGPLRAVLQGDDGAVYQALMDAKAKAMNYIMFSPMTHNMVIYGRAAPEAAKAPISTGLGVNWYVNGNRLRSGSPEIVRDFIQNGLSLIGQGGFIQDITSIRTGQAVVAQHSIEARMLGAVPGLFDARAGAATRAAVEKTGDLLHNTLLWDRIADMQVGMAKFQYDQLIKDGVEHGVAMKTASHWANRFAGALPIEEMSEGARKISNVMWFSRSFTLGNVGAMKDMFVGLPRSVLAQIERDHGVQALNQIQSKAQRKAVGIIATDMALFYAGNSLLQSGIMAMRGEDDEGYIARFKTALGRVAASPLEALNPLAFIHDVTPNAKNEPGKEDRILWGYDSQGTAQYVKNPFGKVTEDQIGWMLHPMKMLDNKLSPMVKPLKEIQANKDFADRNIYNPYAHTPAEYAANVTKAVWHFMAAQVPTDAIKTAYDLAFNKDITPDDRRLDTLKIVGMLSGFSVSQGAKGGPALGELMREKVEHKYALEQSLPDIKKAIKEGRMDEATAKMQELKVEPGLQKFFIQTTLNPGAGVARRAMREMIANMPEERRARFMQHLEKGKPE